MLIYFKTERLLLRNFRDEDLSGFLEYRNDPEVSRYQGWEKNISEKDAVNFISQEKIKPLNLMGSWIQIAIARQDDNEIIGDCAIRRKVPGHQVEFGVTLSRNYQRMGFARETLIGLFSILFTKYNVHRIYGIVDIDNEASIKLQEGLGMRREGHLMQSFLDSELGWRDEYIYAITAKEWELKYKLEPRISVKE